MMKTGREGLQGTQSNGKRDTWTGRQLSSHGLYREFSHPGDALLQ